MDVTVPVNYKTYFKNGKNACGPHQSTEEVMKYMNNSCSNQ